MLLCLQPAHAVDYLLSLETGKSLNLDQNTTGNITFSFTNTGSTITDEFMSWTLGMQVIPSGSVSGNVTIGTLAQAATNPMPIGANPNIYGPVLQNFIGGATLNGSSIYYTMMMETTVGLGTMNAGTSYNMGTLGFTASSNAFGTWNIYAVTQETRSESFWIDSQMTEWDFTNIPHSAGTSSIQVGTITVVPEPGSLALVGLGVGIVTLSACVRRRRLPRGE